MSMLQKFIEPRMREALLTLEVKESLATVGLSEDSIPFEVPRQEGHGHLSCTIAMALAKPLRKPPRAIAESIVNALGSDIPFVEKIEIAGAGFINITFSDAAYHSVLAALAEEADSIGRSTYGAGKRVNVEYVSANPTGPLHAGHGRNCAVGDTIANLYAWCGFDVTREYYFNNAGNQMNKLGESIYARVMHRLGETGASSSQIDLATYPFPEDGYHGEYIYDIARQIVDLAGSAFLAMSIDDQKTFCRQRGEEWCFDSIKKTLQALKIEHDVFFNEDTLYTKGKLKQTVESLRQSGLVYDKDGATWLALEQLGGTQDKVIIKSSGEPTYRLPDIAYHRDKLERGYDFVVDIFGSDHIATIPDVIAGVRALKLDADRIKVVIHQMVTFIEDGNVVKFSKRSGTSFTLDELIEEVGADVVRFFFVMRGVGTHLEFDLGLAKQEGEKNPVFYLQYAHARIASILRKGLEKGLAVNHHADVSMLVHPSEIGLIALLSRFRSVVERSCEHHEPHALAEYLRDLAAAYHNFYHSCKILGAEPQLEESRLLLADVARRAMRNGLHMLGVTAPESM